MYVIYTNSAQMYCISGIDEYEMFYEHTNRNSRA